jgi:hypothetical protein
MGKKQVMTLKLSLAAKLAILSELISPQQVRDEFGEVIEEHPPLLQLTKEELFNLLNGDEQNDN